MTVRRKKLTREQAARKLTDLAMEHLSQFTPAERDARIKAFGRAVTKLAAKRAKYSKDSSALEGRRRIRAHG
jgi:plasmid stabilization system protein ParE